MKKKKNKVKENIDYDAMYCEEMMRRLAKKGFKLEFAKLSMDEQLEFIHTDAFLNAVWKCGYAEAIERYESDK